MTELKSNQETKYKCRREINLFRKISIPGHVILSETSVTFEPLAPIYPLYLDTFRFREMRNVECHKSFNHYHLSFDYHKESVTIRSI
ncbi:hypothetical protein [Staphylococcus massiliensis]|nr:hypothetical protein [Staphylococcus massiliensis]MCG3398741.1 hypothetical protein [Staphylococcus massiliensis]